tara:strand:+ start:4187 stop:4906 length:720 start_codon:yes stop_codon:yes gene_type:complete
MSNINVNNLTPLAGTTGTVSISGSLHVSGNLSANGTLTFGNENTDAIALNAEFTSSLIPDLDDIFDLGSSSKQWKDLYVDGTAYIDSASIQVLYPRTYAGQSFIRVSGSMYPEKTGEFALGVRGGGVTLSRLWKGVHAVTASFDNVSGSLIPDKDNTYDLGSQHSEWKDLYVDGTANLDTISTSDVTIYHPTTASLHTSGASSIVRFENLPTTRPTLTGSLWLSGSAGQDSHFLVVFTG